MSSEFHVSSRPVTGGVVYDLAGDLSTESERVLLELHDWHAFSAEEPANLIFNFTQTSYINSIGIAVLIRIVRAAVKSGRRAYAYGLSSHYAKLFRMVGLTEHMMIYPSEYSVLSAIELGRPLP